MTELLETLIEHRGIGTEFIDAWGNPTEIAEENQQTILKAMGYKIDDTDKLATQLQSEKQEKWAKSLEPVTVFRENAEYRIKIRLPICETDKTYSLVVMIESGDSQDIEIVLGKLSVTDSANVNSVEYQEFAFPIPLEMRCGYHSLQLKVNGVERATSKLIIAPNQCYIPQSIQQGEKVWGLSVQLYCLKSERNWGVGDFTDLSYLIQSSAAMGADFIGLNPIHALYPALPDNCSPYAPSSRQWLNLIYIDVEHVPGYASSSVQRFIDGIDLQTKLKNLRATEYVDYASVTKLKLDVLYKAFLAFLDDSSKENAKRHIHFNAFKTSGGKSLETIAAYEALQSYFKSEGSEYWGWPVFPDVYKRPENKAVKAFVKENQIQVDFHMFLQWQAAEQLKFASDTAKNSGMSIGLYRDLAVGVSEGSAEIWGNQALYRTDVSVGAPPDVLGPLGQKWGLPPMDPNALYEQAYQPIIDLFSSNMLDSGALRIDHAMALLRLWWVHKDDTADKGVYVNYPVEDLLAILALESQRNKSLVIGEDLGTVPDEIRELLKANGIFSYRVFFFEQAQDGGFYSPSHYPEQSMATLTTHDMPTLIGFWHCYDFELGKEVGVYPDSDVLQTLYNDRHDMKQQILNSLHGHHSISDAISSDVNHVGMTKDLNYGLQTHMATGSSALLSLQLEDWLQMDKPVNIPGTYNEYPNWRRKLSSNLEDIFADSEMKALAAALTDKRHLASNQ